jgi:hypothetical protein
VNVTVYRTPVTMPMYSALPTEMAATTKMIWLTILLIVSPATTLRITRGCKPSRASGLLGYPFFLPM